MKKNLLITIICISGILGLASSAFAKYYSNNFPLTNQCDKYLEILETSTDQLARSNALSMYNSCSAKEVTNSVTSGVNKSIILMYLSLASSFIFIVSVAILLIQNKKYKKDKIS